MADADGPGAATEGPAAGDPEGSRPGCPGVEPGTPEHLANYSKAFAAAADVVLVVEEAALPAHSHVLRMHSDVLDDALDILLTSSEKKLLPEDGLPCLALHWPATEEQARAFLRVLYSKEVEPAKRMLSEDNARLIARLAHQLNVAHLLKECDAWLTQWADGIVERDKYTDMFINSCGQLARCV